MSRFQKYGIFTFIGMGAIAVLFLLIFDRYTYEDYLEGSCDDGGGQLVAELVGRFDPERSRVRGSPYNLKFKVMPGYGAGETNVQQLMLTVIATGRDLELGGKDLWLRKVKREDGVIVLALDDLMIPYEDYRLTGELV